ncbi:MAG: hypothetical protein JJT88_16020 [Gammaproteobacteria bacterium]|nr:hypothetical protein [Gammaproteobacteria bacterium]
MKIHRNPQDHQWILSSGPHVLYRGARSPWLSPELLREAARRERALQEGQGQAAPVER